MLNSLKIIFIGTGDFAAPILETLIKKNILIKFIITKGVSQYAPTPVGKIATKHKIKIINIKNINKYKIRPGRIDLIITADYGQIIPKKIINMPKFGCINIHPSLLPKYRGPSPIQTAILNGDKITGITIMLMDEKIDHGPIIAQKKIFLTNKETGLDLEKNLAKKAGLFLIKILPKYISKEIKIKKQNHKQASYTKILTRQDGKINFKKEKIINIEKKIRAFYPWPGTWTMFNKKRVKIIKAKLTKNKELKLEIVQPAGKKPMTYKEFLRGHRTPLSF